MNILILVTGSISAYKAVDIANALRYKEHNVKIVCSKAALQFIPKLTFTGQRFECYTDEDEWNSSVSGVLHINLAKWADLLLVAPATSNTIGKFVNGITDNLVLSIMRAFSKTIYIAPAMNTQMYNNSEVFLNKLKDFNTIVIPTQEKLLACGDYGLGGLANKNEIIEIILKMSN
jgi:phosphopantothenoylcysteine synthetase/decarboxylase